MDTQPTQDSAPDRKVPLPLAILPLLFMAGLLGVGYGVYKIKPQVLLVVAAFFTGLLALFLRFNWKEMERGIVDSI
ncbi:MAG: hypothetical protein MUP19_05725, partial [Candidatus Aminicenantes bacterium]|nr:hypothetical protein [Candidatus Aminicenantes bacterium]